LNEYNQTDISSIIWIFMIGKQTLKKAL